MNIQLAHTKILLPHNDSMMPNVPQNHYVMNPSEMRYLDSTSINLNKITEKPKTYVKNRKISRIDILIKPNFVV